MPYDLTDEQRDRYRATSIRSQLRKQTLLRGHDEAKPVLGINLGERLDPDDLMPQLEVNGLTSLSLFSGGGGLDIGLERAGFEHRASLEILDICGETLRANRPDWAVLSGAVAGDVRAAAFTTFRGVDLVHGGPPCQPFSIAGKQAGADDPRNMWPDFVRCILQTRPRAFIAENVPGMLDQKFEAFIRDNIVNPLSSQYTIFKFKLAAHDFGVPQSRRRVFFVGFRAARDAARWVEPEPTHGDVGTLFGPLLPRNTARKTLGLAGIGFDVVAPTLRSGFTGPRNTTGVLNSKASLNVWNDLHIWPNGVQPTRSMAAAYPPRKWPLPHVCQRLRFAAGVSCRLAFQRCGVPGAGPDRKQRLSACRLCGCAAGRARARNCLMTVQDDERERELVRAFGLTWNRDHQRAGIDALLNIELDGRICEFEVGVKSSTVSTVSTARDVGMEHIEKWRRKLFVIGFYSRSSGRPELLRCLCLTPLDMEPWIASIESKIAIDFALASRASRKLELDDLFDVCGRQTTYSVEDAKRLHKLQWTSQQYADALDTTENGRPRISQGRMLGILRLRSKYIAQRGATLNNSHVTKTHLHTFAGTSREVQVPNWAASIRAIAKEFAQAHPDHPAVIR